MKLNNDVIPLMYLFFLGVAVVAIKALTAVHCLWISNYSCDRSPRLTVAEMEAPAPVICLRQSVEP